jgi:muramoyltetrapeptide carboxypeptidase
MALGGMEGTLVRGKACSGPIKLVGGCLSVLVVMLAGPLARRVKPDGRWLAIEDLNEPPYCVDRHLATLKIAGWFERAEGVLVGSFHTKRVDQTPAALELLKYHLPTDRQTPVVTTGSFGHVWPMVPLPINCELKMSVRGRKVMIDT